MRLKQLIGIIFFITMLASCTAKPEPIAYGKDGCSFCKMTIMDAKFAAELVTSKGKVAKFDDLHCLVKFQAAATDTAYAFALVNNFDNPSEFLNIAEAHFVHAEAYKSPMRGDVAAFAANARPLDPTDSLKHPLTWQQVQEKFNK